MGYAWTYSKLTVIFNLGVNACDAMPNGGTLSMQTTNIILVEAYALQHLRNIMPYWAQF